MQEQQGNLEEPLSGLPGPRPFNKKTKKDNAMENKKVDDIVSQTARALGAGKSFGGWTDKVEEDTHQRHVKKQHASREREKKKEEPLTIHGPDGTRKNPQYSKFTYPSDVIKKESVEYLDEKLATQSLPRQLKDPKSEMLVTAPPTKKNPNGKTFVIYKSEWPKHKKSGHTVAEGVGAMIGGAIGSVVPGVGTAIGAAVGKGAEWLAGAVANNKKKFKKSKSAGEGATE